MPTRLRGPSGARRLALACLLTAGCSAETQPALEFEGQLSVAGRLTLTGALADAREGGVCLRLSEKRTGRVLLQRVYDLGDPLWDRRDQAQALYFALSREDTLEASPPIHEPLELSVVYLEPGLTRPTRELEPRLTMAYSVPVADAQLTLHASSPIAEVAEPLRAKPSPR